MHDFDRISSLVSDFYMYAISRVYAKVVVVVVILNYKYKQTVSRNEIFKQ